MMLTPLFKKRKPGLKGQVRENLLFRDPAYRNNGILECWNNGFSGMGSVFIAMARIKNENLTIIRF
jgi:hypothetical protein